MRLSWIKECGEESALALEADEYYMGIGVVPHEWIHGGCHSSSAGGGIAVVAVVMRLQYRGWLNG
jgi:hypothetical protein